MLVFALLFFGCFYSEKYQNFHTFSKFFAVKFITNCATMLMFQAGDVPGQTGQVTEDQFFTDVRNGHSAMNSVLAARSKNLDTIKVMWTSRNIKVPTEECFTNVWCIVL